MYVPKQSTELARYVHTDIFGNKDEGLSLPAGAWTACKLIAEARDIQRLPPSL
jgi:hypothetical protein